MDSKQELTAKEILSLEEKIIDPETSKTPSILEGIISDDFLEFGSSGRKFTKQTVIAALSMPSNAKIEISDLKIKYLADNVVIATYIATKISDDGKSLSLRSSIWIFKDSRWQIVFHQGTVSKGL
jgi:hypothetical protein